MSKLVRSVFPLLVVLRLCDEQESFMDKLFFYVRKMDKTLIKSKEILDHAEKVFQRTSWRTVYDSNPSEDSSDDSESPESEYDSETCAEDDSVATITLGQKVLEIWNKRRKSLINDFSIAGWL